MEKDDFDWDDYTNTAGMRPRLLPVQATELLGGIGSQILRSLLLAAPDDIPEDYACFPEQAAVALACCELAELSVWDEAALIEAATIGACEEQRLMWGCESRDRLARRISLAMKAEKAPEVMSPADGVLLLRRAGIHVFHQLLDAVAVMTIHTYTPESQSLYRQLKGIAEPQQKAPATDTAKPLPEVAVDASDGVEPDAGQLAASQPRATTPSHAPVATASADTASAQNPRTTATGPKFSTRRDVMINRHVHEWPTIDRDMKDASQNGLAAAKAGLRDWDESAAMAWAGAKGKLKNAEKPTDALTKAVHSMGNLPVRKHTLEG